LGIIPHLASRAKGLFSNCKKALFSRAEMSSDSKVGENRWGRLGRLRGW
jgi:hypothetical protein